MKITALIAIIAVAGIVSACTAAQQELAATQIAEDTEIQDRLIEAGNILETREAEYTPTPIALHEVEATATHEAEYAEKFIERTCQHWEEEASWMLKNAETNILSDVFNHQPNNRRATSDPPEWDSWAGGDNPPAFECPDHMAKVAPHVTATAVTAYLIATAYIDECGEDVDDIPIQCLVGWEYNPERREMEATAEVERQAFGATVEAQNKAFNATMIAGIPAERATTTAIAEHFIARATAEAEATATATAERATWGTPVVVTVSTGR